MEDLIDFNGSAISKQETEPELKPKERSKDVFSPEASLQHQLDRDSPSLSFVGRPSLTGHESFQFFNNMLNNVEVEAGRASLTGRESLQIFNNVLDDVEAEAGRASLTGRESLQIFKNVNLLKDIEEAGRCSLTGRESLQIFRNVHLLKDIEAEGRGSLGRESLGILPDAKLLSLLSPNDVSAGSNALRTLSLLSPNPVTSNTNAPNEISPDTTGSNALRTLCLLSPIPIASTSDSNVNMLNSNLSTNSNQKSSNDTFLSPLAAKSSSEIKTNSVEVTTNPSYDTLDAFLSLNPLKSTSSISSINTNFELSRISSIGAISNNNTVFNNAFCGGTTSEQSEAFDTSQLSILNKNVDVCKMSGEEFRERIQSLPLRMNKLIRDEAVRSFSEKEATSRRSISKSASLDDLDDDVFNDSVYIEAHYLASKIEDGSILDASFEENSSLDRTPHPEWNISETEEKPKCDTETVFKTVDKLLPPTISKAADSSIKNVSVTSNKNTSSDSNGSNNIQNLSEIQNLQPNTSKISNNSNNSRSRDTKEILQNLSDILNEHRDPQQKLAGQSLLYNLVDILCSDNDSSKKNESLEDSGHSSIEIDDNAAEKHECYQVLDLSNKPTNKSVDNEKVLDLSCKIKRMTHSFSFPSPKVPALKISNKLRSQMESMKRVSGSAEVKGSLSEASKGRLSFSSSNIAVKLKAKKVEEKPVGKKGPLKALVPIGGFMKLKDANKSKAASEKTPPRPLEVPKSKLTSTPIRGSNVRPPIAQSTPEDQKHLLKQNKPVACSSQLKKKRFSCPVSPLTRPSISNLSTNNSSKSDSNNDVINNNTSGTSSTSKSLNRRVSASDLKTLNKPMERKRSYSIGGKENFSSLRKTAIPTNKIKPEIGGVLKTSFKDSSNKIKPFNLMAKIRNSKKPEVV